MRAPVVGVEWRRCCLHMGRAWLMLIRDSMAALEVVRRAFDRGMPWGCIPPRAVLRRLVGRLVRSSLPLRLGACIVRMELGIGMGEVPLLLWQKGTEVTELEVILFR